MKGDRGKSEGATGADKSNLAASPAKLESIERSILALSLLVRVPLLRLQSRFLRCACRFGRPALPGNYQCVSDEIREALLGEVTIAALAPHVARHHANTSLSGEPRRELVEQPRALLVGQRP